LTAAARLPEVVYAPPPSGTVPIGQDAVPFTCVPFGEATDPPSTTAYPGGPGALPLVVTGDLSESGMAAGRPVRTDLPAAASAAPLTTAGPPSVRAPRRHPPRRSAASVPWFRASDSPLLVGLLTIIREHPGTAPPTARPTCSPHPLCSGRPGSAMGQIATVADRPPERRVDIAAGSADASARVAPHDRSDW